MVFKTKLGISWSIEITEQKTKRCCIHYCIRKTRDKELFIFVNNIVGYGQPKLIHQLYDRCQKIVKNYDQVLLVISKFPQNPLFFTMGIGNFIRLLEFGLKFGQIVF